MVIIDHRNICKIASYSILSGTISSIFPTEIEEIAHRIAKRLLCLRLDFPNDTLAFADDKKPYWRTKYINQWYVTRGLEPITYKGNRGQSVWPFQTTPERMDKLYNELKLRMAEALNALIIEDVGLEADDVWGIIAKSATVPMVGVSTDSDWRQLCSIDKITVLDPAQNIKYCAPVDIRPKMICGDRGDNIMGCPKRRKDGTLMKSNWGIDGAMKLLAKPNWQLGLDGEILERNRILIELPCPLWDLKELEEALSSCITTPTTVTTEERDAIFTRYGLTVSVRQSMEDQAARSAWIESMRVKLQEQNNVAEKEESKDA